MRQVGRSLNYTPGSEPHNDLLYRIGGLYEKAGNRRAGRRVLLEIFAQDPRFRDVSQRLDVLTQDVVAVPTVDERIIELVDVGATLGSIFDSLQDADLTIDPSLLLGRKSSVIMKAADLRP